MEIRQLSRLAPRDLSLPRFALRRDEAAASRRGSSVTGDLREHLGHKPVKPKKRTPEQMLRRMIKAFHNKPIVDLLSNNEDWSDPVKRGATANEVLSFGASTAGQSEYALDDYGVMLRKVFDATGLNPDNPHNWQFILRMFAYIHFGPTDKEIKYIEIAMKVHALIPVERKRNLAVAAAAKHFSISTKTVWNALAWAENFEHCR
jgi:hypothetical protein